jgi:hypothetical protein
LTDARHGGAKCQCPSLHVQRPHLLRIRRVSAAIGARPGTHRPRVDACGAAGRK